VMFSCNFRACAESPVAEFEKEIAQVLVTAGLGTYGTDIFIAPKAVIPTGAGPYISILDTGGSEPKETHNGDVYVEMSCQVVVTGASMSATRAKAVAVWGALDGVRNTTVTASF